MGEAGLGMRAGHPRYLQFGDIKVFSAEAPDRIAGLTAAAYLGFTARTAAS